MLQLVIGCAYRTRDGRDVLIKSTSDPMQSGEYVFYGTLPGSHLGCWHSDGSWVRDRSSPQDLIELVAAGDSTQATTFHALPVVDLMPHVVPHPSTPAANPKDAIGDKKLALHLVSPIIKVYQAIATFLGNVKYGAWNYRVAGVRSSVYYAALNRHMDAWWEGEELDPADGTPHLANALACIGILIEAKHSGTLIDDRPPSRAGELTALRANFEALMVKIREQHKDKNPRHFTIADSNLKL